MVFVRRFGVLILGLVLLVLGLAQIIVELAIVRSASFGWTAYAPLTSTTFFPAPASSTFGLLAVLIGAILVAGWVGFHLGHRRDRSG